VRLLDTFCKAGGCSAGYRRAGFTEIVGVDNKPQPRYPFEFVQADAIEYIREHGHEFDAIHASPPCQRYSTITKHTSEAKRRAKAKTAQDHPDLIVPTRAALVASGKPYVIENVPGAPLIEPVLLCGSMFGLQVRRHRLFEVALGRPNVFQPQPQCSHKRQGRVVGVYGHSGGSSKRDGISFSGVEAWKAAMDIDWMTGAELAEAIPPAYTEYIGRQLLLYLPTEPSKGEL